MGYKNKYCIEKYESLDFWLRDVKELAKSLLKDMKINPELWKDINGCSEFRRKVHKKLKV